MSGLRAYQKAKEFFATLKQSLAKALEELLLFVLTLVGVSAALLLFVLGLYSCFSMLASIIHFDIQNAMVYFFLTLFFWGIIGITWFCMLDANAYYPITVLGWGFLGVAVFIEIFLRTRMDTNSPDLIAHFLKGEMTWQLI